MISRSTKPNGNDQEDGAQSSSSPEKNPLKRLLARLSEDPYRPEKHYMRGPGPKAKAKAALRAESVRPLHTPKSIGPGK
jgi:hypothetical protein